MMKSDDPKRDNALLIAGGIALAVGAIIGVLVIVFSNEVLGCIHSLMTMTNQDWALVMFAFGIPVLLMIGVIVLWIAGIAATFTGLITGGILLWIGFKTRKKQDMADHP